MPRKLAWTLSSVILLALAGALLPACQSSAVVVAPSTDESSAVQETAVEDANAAWARQTSPFVVRDEAGVAYDEPFLGGFNVPRPQLIDIDNDGDVDLFVQEATERLMFFEQTGTLDAPKYRWRTDKYQDLDIGEWYRFADLDQDGDMDMLAEEKHSYIRAYLNTGTKEVAHFVLGADSLKDSRGVPIFSDRQNIPNLVDIDCDGNLDLFIGRTTGTVMRYEASGVDENGLPVFDLITDRFQDIEILGQFGSMHGANTLTFADYDGDGDRDLFWGDFFEPGLLLMENVGSCERVEINTNPVSFPPEEPMSTSGYNAPASGDFDGDGDQDLMIGVLGGAFNPNRTASSNLYFYRNNDGVFDQETTKFISMIDVGGESHPVLTDLDLDGDLDLLVSNKIDPIKLGESSVTVFENTGTPTSPEFKLDRQIGLESNYHHTPASGDLDGDGTAELVVGGWTKDIALYTREEDDTYVRTNDRFVRLTRGSNSTAALADMDNDGDLDLFSGEGSGDINYWENTGSSTGAVFTLVSDKFEGIDVGRRSYPVPVDLDMDGDLDLAIGSETKGILVYENVGSPEAFEFVQIDSLPMETQGFATPAFGDLDGDGDPDLIVGGYSGGLLFFENLLVK